jgi:preprotein translocase subunit SecF
MEFFRRTPNIDFMGKRRITYVISAILMIGSLVLLATRGLNLGIDFTGGVVVEVIYPGTADIDGARSALEQAGFDDAQVQSFGSSRDLAVRVMPEAGEDVNEVSARVAAALGQAEPGVEVRRTEVVGPQVGKELTEQGGLAMLFCFIGILIYVGFRFEKKMAASTVLAAIHDPLFILGFFAATQMTFDLTVLASVLAVIGYSINDTVVVFDRVREVFLEKRKATPFEVLNLSLNQTLSRTLMTSFSVLFVVLSLYFFAGESLLALDMGLKAQDLMSIKKEDPELDALP